MKKICKVKKMTVQEMLNSYSANAKELWHNYQERLHFWDDEYLNDDDYADYLDREYEMCKDRMLFGW